MPIGRYTGRLSEIPAEAQRLPPNASPPVLPPSIQSDDPIYQNNTFGKTTRSNLGHVKTADIFSTYLLKKRLIEKYLRRIDQSI